MTDTLAPPPPISDWKAPVQPADANGLTMTDYTRKIHWWVRLVGVVWLTSMIIGVVIGAIAIIAVGVEAGKTDVNMPASVHNEIFSSRASCMSASWTTAAECNSLFPND